MGTRARVLAFAAANLALALAACGADATPSAQPAAPGQTAAAEVTSESQPADSAMSLNPCLLSGDEIASVLGC